MSADPLLSIPGLGGYIAQDKLNREKETRDVASAVHFQSLQQHYQQMEEKARQAALDKSYRAELDALAPDQRTPENFAKVGAKYAPAKDLYHYSQQALDRRATTDSNREVALSRLHQSAQTAAQNYELRLRGLTRQEDKDAITRQYQEYLANLRGEAARYNTGAKIPDFAFSLPSRQSAGALPANVPASDEAAFRAAQAGGAGTVNRQVSPQEQASMVQMPSGGGAPVPQEIADSQRAADANARTDYANARSEQDRSQIRQVTGSTHEQLGSPPPVPPTLNDSERETYLLSQRGGAQAPAAPQAGPTPVAAPAPQPAAPAAPQMPPEVAALPKKLRDQWIARNTPSAGAGAMNPEAVGVAAWEKLLFGTDPKGMGTASSQQRAQIANERARIGRGLGLTDTEMAMLPQDNKVKMKAVDKLTTWGAFVGKAADQLEKSIDLAISYVEKMDPQTLQSVNRAILAGRKEFNDPVANQYALQVNAVRTEYSRLMAGPTSNAMLPVEAMKKGDEIIGKGMDVAAWKGIRQALIADAKITRDSVQDQITGLRGSITGRTQPEAPKADKPLSEMTNAELKRMRDELKARGGR